MPERIFVKIGMGVRKRSLFTRITTSCNGAFRKAESQGCAPVRGGPGVTAALRACVLPPATTEDDLVVLPDETRAAAKELAA
jgi:hypothetical protein